WNLHEDIRGFAQTGDSLQQVVLLVDREEGVAALSSTELTAALARLFTKGGSQQLLSGCTAQLELLRFQCHLFPASPARRVPLARARDLDDLNHLIVPVTAQLSGFFQADVCTVADLAVPAKDHYAMLVDTPAARAQLREAVRNAESGPNPAVEQIRLLVNLV